VCACETFPEDVHEESIMDEDSETESTNFRKQRLSMKLWEWIVQFYSRTLLTRETDRLDAISRVAKR
jgi:hypothetical protein